MKATNDWMEEELLKVMMEQCPFEIPDDEKETANEVLREVVFGKKEEVICK